MHRRWHAGLMLTLLSIMAVRQVDAEPAPLPLPLSSVPGSSASSPASSPAAVAAAEPAITEVSVSANEPRYVAPTLRDHLGRIWAPVYLNGRGPYRLVLDTGASSSAITARVAGDLGLPLAGAHTVMLHGVTGSAIVPFVSIDTFVVGDMEAHDRVLPIVPDALGGADGVLGTDGLEDKRITIDFLHDRISINHSRGRRAEAGYVTIPLLRTANGLLMTTAYVGGVRVKAIIDTGGQATVANHALQVALDRHHHPDNPLQPSSITGATDDVQLGHDLPTPPIMMGPVIIRSRFLTIVDLDIFERWDLTREPAMLIGIDTLGLLDNLIIDYRRMELQVRTRQSP